MRNLLALFMTAIFICSTSNAYEVLEDLGETYPIEDVDMLSEMEKEFNKIDKKQLKKELVSRIKEKLVARHNLPMCKQTKTRTIKREQFKGFDFEEMDIHIKPTALPRWNQVETFVVLNTERKKELNWLFQKMKPSDKILISKGNIDTKVLGNFKQRYILDETFLKIADIKCTPTILKIKDNEFILDEISIEMDLEE